MLCCFQKCSPHLLLLCSLFPPSTGRSLPRGFVRLLTRQPNDDDDPRRHRSHQGVSQSSVRVCCISTSLNQERFIYHSGRATA